MNFKALIFTIFAVFIALNIVSCANFKRDSFDKGILTVAISGTTPPYSFYSPESNELTGFDIDVANEMARRLKKKLVVETYPFNKIIYAVIGNQVDCGMESIYISPERQKVVDFTIPYNGDITKLAVLDKFKGLNTVEDIKQSNLPISMRNGTVYPKVLKKMGFEDSQFVIYPDQTDLNLAIQNNEVKVIASGYKRLKYLKEKNGFKIKFVEPPVVTFQYSGIIVNKRNKDILAKLNTTLAAMIKDGTYHRIAMKWFSEDPLIEGQKGVFKP